MKALLILLSAIAAGLTSSAQTTWQVCVEDPPSTTCPGKTGTFTPGNLTIQQGDMIQFTTTYVALSGYTGTNHTIEFTGSPANNVILPVSNDIFNQVTTVTTPPFNTPGTFPMECTNFNHCLLSEYSCTGYSVTVVPNCDVTADFTTTPSTSVCTGTVLDFTNNSTNANTYSWRLDEFEFSTSTNAVISFAAAGSYDIELVAGDGTCEDSMTVTINVDPESDAGSDTTQLFCNIDDSIDLDDLVDGDTGGWWEEVTSSGQFNTSNGVFHYNGLSPQDYEFYYIVPGIGVCPNDTAEFTIEINQEPALTLNLGSTPIAASDSLSIDFTPVNVLPGAQYLWDFCDGNLQTDTLPFYYSWDTGGNLCVCVTVNNTNGCLEEFCDSSIVIIDDAGIADSKVDEVAIYPNPTNGWLNVVLDNFSGDFDLMIRDVSGKNVLQHKVVGGSTFQLNTTKLSDGTYTLVLIADENRWQSQFIKY